MRVTTKDSRAHRKLVTQRAGRDDQMIKSATCQSRIAALFEHIKMDGKQRVQIGVLGIHGDSLRLAAIVPRCA